MVGLTVFVFNILLISSTFQDENGVNSVKSSNFELQYLKFLESFIPDIQHKYNTPRRPLRLSGQIMDAYSPSLKQAFYANG